MSAQPPTYDLMLLLDPQAEPETRSKIIADVLAAIAAGGELLRHDEWGERPLAYPIERKASAEYHLLQFHTAGAGLLGELDHTLRITDGVLRFRIVKLKPGVPDAPDMRSSTAPARRSESEPPPQAQTDGEVEVALAEPA
jgi:small subunit ribosomal protein S6